MMEAGFSHEQHAADARLYRQAIKWMLTHHRRADPTHEGSTKWVNDRGLRVFPPMGVGAILAVIEQEVWLEAEHAG